MDIQALLAESGTLADLYRQNPEPSGFRLHWRGRTYARKFPSYEAVEAHAKAQGLNANSWSAEPVP